MALNWILIIMLGMGIAGGYVGFLFAGNDPGPDPDTKNDPVNKADEGNKKDIENTKEELPVTKSLGQYIAMGIGATILVPLFLQIVQSSLMNDIVKGWEVKSSDKINYLQQYLLYAAYCFAAAVTSFEFIKRIVQTAVYQKIAKEAEQKAATAKVKAKVAEEKEKEAEMKASQAKHEAQEAQVDANQKGAKLERITSQKRAALKNKGLEKNRASILESTVEKEGPAIKPITHPDDPQKDRFGGNARANGRLVSAQVFTTRDPDNFRVIVTVTSIDEKKPLSGNVIFYLHDTFFDPVQTVPVDEGKAVWEDPKVWGAFTVGVVADDGETLLELDLAELPGAPALFKSR